MALELIKTEVIERGSRMYGVHVIRSKSNPEKTYRVDVTNGRCDCPGWKFQKAIDGARRPCSHLRELGFTALINQPAKAPKAPKPAVEPLPASHYKDLI